MCTMNNKDTQAGCQIRSSQTERKVHRGHRQGQREAEEEEQVGERLRQKEAPPNGPFDSCKLKKTKKIPIPALVAH